MKNKQIIIISKIKLIVCNLVDWFRFGNCFYCLWYDFLNGLNEGWYVLWIFIYNNIDV